MRNIRQLPDRLDGSGFIIGMHDANQDSLLSHRLLANVCKYEISAIAKKQKPQLNLLQFLFE